MNADVALTTDSNDPIVCTYEETNPDSFGVARFSLEQQLSLQGYIDRTAPPGSKTQHSDIRINGVKGVAFPRAHYCGIGVPVGTGLLELYVDGFHHKSCMELAKTIMTEYADQVAAK